MFVLKRKEKKENTNKVDGNNNYKIRCIDIVSDLVTFNNQPIENQSPIVSYKFANEPSLVFMGINKTWVKPLLLYLPIEYKIIVPNSLLIKFLWFLLKIQISFDANEEKLLRLKQNLKPLTLSKEGSQIN